MERLEEFGFEQIRAGTLYRTLRQMEQEGLCSSEWETPQGGPARRMYLILKVGKNISQPGRRRVSSTRVLWTVSPRPTRVGSPELPCTAKSSSPRAGCRPTPRAAGRALGAIVLPAGGLVYPVPHR